MSDASILLAWRNDQEVCRWSRVSSPQTDLKGHLKWLRSRIDGKPGEILRIIQTEYEEIPVGLIWRTFDPDSVDIPEIHYRVDPLWRHQGIASMAVPTFVGEVLQHINGGVFKCPIVEGNVPSERLAAKLGLHPGHRLQLGESDPRIIVDWVQ
jgi:RimJ/RimL family protein N-acetyltransferase